MKQLQFLLCFSLFFGLNLLEAQIFTDNFTDGNFTQNPTWTGDTQNFEILNGELHLFHQNPEANNESVLVSAVAQQTGVETTWEFYFRLAFDPSSSNRARVYLQANKPDLASDLNGYYIELGASGADDAIKLYKQNGTTSTLLVEGTAGDIAIEPAAKVRVVRSANSEWELLYDLDGNGYNSYGKATDNEFESGNFMGVWCDYIASRAELFYFDDFVVNPIYIDTDAPTLISTVVLSGNQIQLNFSEIIDNQTLANLNNFLVNNLAPTEAILSEDGTSIILVFANNFNENTLQTLQFTVADIAGNATTANTSFTYAPTQTFDVLITEIMADPSPTVGLPDIEYIELFNRSENNINLLDWQLLDASSETQLPDYELKAGEYITLVDGENFQLDVLNIPYLVIDFPSLTNDGELLQLKNKQGKTIVQVNYLSKWHVSNKKDGGWSLEMINPNNPCGGSSNWTSSVANKGGTPSAQNSVYNTSLVDAQKPQLLRVGYVNEASILAYFSETLDVTKISETNFSINNGIGEPILTTVIEPENNSILLSLGSLLQANQIYTLTANALCDCVGNVIEQNNTAQFAVPVAAQANDIIINEILFDQATGNTDFVEIYNNSDKIIDLKNSRFSRDGYTVSNGEVVLENNPLEIKITENSYLLFPQQYLVLTEDQDLVKQQYFTQNTQAFLDIPSFPTLDAKQDAIYVKDSLGNVLDQVLYTSNWHYSLLDITKGVSLERTSFNATSQAAATWHSASASVGYATPGYLNSQFFQLPELSQSFALTPEVFSPNGDGYNDSVVLNYEFEEPGYTLNCYIFDDRGRQIKHLVQNELLGRNGTFRWDGENTNNEKANIGIYIFYIEIFNLDGKVERFKRTCTLAGQL